MFTEGDYDYYNRVIKVELGNGLTNDILLEAKPFTKLLQVNNVLKPYYVKVFNVSSMKCIDFIDTADGKTLLTLRNTTIKNIQIADLVTAIKRRR